MSVDRAVATAAAVASLLLDARGRLPRYEVFDCAVRGALLVDLGLAGRVVQRPDCIEIDTSATGQQLLDELLTLLVADPRTSIDGLVAAGPVSLADVGRHLGATGAWSARGARPSRRRFDVVDPALAHLRRLSSSGLHTAEPAVWCLLDASGVVLGPPRPSWRRTDPTGDVVWLVGAVEDALRSVRRTNQEWGRVLRWNAAGGAFR